MLIAFIVFYNLNAATIFFANDQATDFIIARYASEGNLPLLGPPSHTGGRHLGPMYYWFVIAAAWISSFDIIQSTWIFIIAKLCVIAGLFFVARIFLKGREILIFVVALTFCFVSAKYLDVLRIQWHSNYLIIPSTLAVMSAVAVVRSGVHLFPLFFVAQSILLQSHLSAGPAVLGLDLAVFIFCILPGNRHIFWQSLRSKYFALAVFAVVVMWIPTIVYEMSYPSNIAMLASAHGGSLHAKAGISSALDTLCRYIATYSFTLPQKGIWKYVYIIIGCGFLFCLGHMLIKGTRKDRWTLFILAAPLLVTTCFLVKFKAPLMLHYFNSSIIIPPLLFAFAAAHAVHVIFNFDGKHKVARAVSAIFLVLVVIMIPHRARAGFIRYTKKPFESFHSYQQAESLVSFIKRDAGEENPLIFTRMSAKASRNAYYYLLNNGHSEIEYRRFFNEYPRLHKSKGTAENKKSYIIVCPAGFRKVESEMVRSLSKKWVLDKKLNTKSDRSVAACSVFRMRKAAR